MDNARCDYRYCDRINTAKTTIMMTKGLKHSCVDNARCDYRYCDRITTEAQALTHS